MRRLVCRAVVSHMLHAGTLAVTAWKGGLPPRVILVLQNLKGTSGGGGETFEHSHIRIQQQRYWQLSR